MSVPVTASRLAHPAVPAPSVLRRRGGSPARSRHQPSRRAPGADPPCRQLAAGRLDDQVALREAGSRRWAVVLDVPDEQSVGVRQSDGPRSRLATWAGATPIPGRTRCFDSPRPAVHACAGSHPPGSRGRNLRLIGSCSVRAAVRRPDNRPARRAGQQRRVMFDASQISVGHEVRGSCVQPRSRSPASPAALGHPVGECEDGGAGPGLLSVAHSTAGSLPSTSRTARSPSIISPLTWPTALCPSANVTPT